MHVYHPLSLSTPKNLLKFKTLYYQTQNHSVFKNIPKSVTTRMNKGFGFTSFHDLDVLRDGAG